MEVKQLKITEVVENPENPRRKLGDIGGLTASIAAIGLVEPIVVRQLEEGPDGEHLYIIVSGARRFAACKALDHDTVPCVIRENETNEALASIAENTAREDLSVDELAGAVSRLEGLSMSDEELSAALAITTVSVGHARAVSNASKKAKAKLKELAPKSRQFTLEESATVIKYAEDESRVEELSDTLEYDPGQLPHLIAQYEQEDDRMATVNALRATVAGKIEVKSFRDWERPPAGTEPLHNLSTADGKALTEARHRDCPNAGFLIQHERHDWQGKEPKIVHYCVNWEASGHKLSTKPKQVWETSRSGSGATKAMTPQEAEKATAERRKVIANNKLWGPATSVRTTWLESFGLRREINSSAKQWVLGEIIIEPTKISRTTFVGQVASLDNRFVIIFNQLVAYREMELKTYSWRPPGHMKHVFDRYLRMLQDQGYPVSEVEKCLLIDTKGASKNDDIEIDEFGDAA